MNNRIRNILAIVAGLVAGSIINMGLIMWGSHIIPAPAGLDVTTMEGLKKALPLFETKHFVFPFLAHALGTLAGAIIAAMIVRDGKMKYALWIGFVFFLGGASNFYSIPSPFWFILVDLLFAYFPFAYLGGRMAAVIGKRK